MATGWFYADAQHRQQGPVDAGLLRRYHERGEVTRETLVWREGMQGWAPFASVAAELGVELAPSAATQAHPAARRRVAIAPSKSSNVAVIIAVVAVGLLFVLGIFAAIAIPAYQDYVTRAKVAEAYNAIAPLRLAVSEHVLEHGSCPANGDGDIGTPSSYAGANVAAVHVGALEDGSCAIRIVLAGIAVRDARDAEIVATFDAEQGWRHSSTIDPRYLPVTLRGSTGG
ncbi:MAG TPA: GYF domain-containing protein [Candidatus Saccharimonadia bacterium]|nr:GYF domain-containing protein [Candidatus Saccharimonadia bacterium]